MEFVKKIVRKINRDESDRGRAKKESYKDVIYISSEFLANLENGSPVKLEEMLESEQVEEVEETAEEMEKFKYRLVGKFCDQHPNILVLNAKARWLWSVPRREQPLIMPIGEDTGYYMINMESKKEMKRALKQKPWFFNFQMMRVFRPRNFGPSFDPQLDDAGIHLCWIQLPDMSSNYTKEEMIFAVWKQIGTPLKIQLLDESNVRIHVAIDVSSQPEMLKEISVHKIDDESAAGISQRIVYEEKTLPPYCSGCRTMGHDGGESCRFETKWEDKDPSIEEEMGDDAFILYSLHYDGTTMDAASIAEAADTILTLVGGTQAVRSPYNVKYVYKDGTCVGEAQFELPVVADEFGMSLVLGNAPPKRYTLESFPALLP